MSTEMNRMTTQNSQLTTSKTALVSSSHEQFIPERMNTTSKIVKRISLLLTAVLISVTTALAQCPNPITAVTLTVNDQPCGSPSVNGSMTVAVTGGVAPYTYSWTRNGTAYVTTPANTNAPTNLIAGNYIVSVTDACGVAAVSSATVTLSNAIAIDLQNATLGANALCFGGNGTISASIFGGTSQRSLVVTNTVTSQVYTQLSPSGPAVGGVYPYSISVPQGTYSVSAVDAGSTCPSETWLTNVTVGQPASALTATTAKTDVCFGGTNGTITVTATGGTGTKTYSKDGGVTFQASNIFTGLAAGTYSIVVQDANNCTTTPASVTINQSGSALTVAVTSVTNVACNGASTGAVNLTATGGYSTAYTYAWTGPSSYTATTEDLTNRPAGVYNVTVTDAGGCTQTATATILQPTALTAGAVATNVLCFGGSTGSVNLTVSGGTAPYTYAWTGPSSYTATTEDLINRPAGTYAVTVTDANNCTVNASATITQPTVLASSNVVTNVLCNGTSTGAINLTVTGGTTPYTFAWTGTSFTATTEDLASRPVGTYAVVITDANGCTANASATITQPTALTLTAVNTPVSCNGGTNGTITATAGGGTTGYTYSINGTTFQASANFTGLAAGTYTVTVRDANNCTTTATTTITQPTALATSTAVTNVLCNGASTGAINLTVTGGSTPYSFAWTGTSFTATTEDLASRPAGTYAVVITDANGCTANASATITQPTLLVASGVKTNVSCFGGSNGTITASATGGTAPYTYSINGTTFQASTSFTGLAAGTYTVTVRDANNCTVTSATITITQPTALAITDDGGSPASCANTTDGAYFISVSGGTSPYTYAWTGPNSFTSATQDQVYNLAPGTYAVTVTDANSCTATLTNLVITSPPAINIATVATNATCFQGTNGAINATITGGSPAFTFQWKKNGVNFATTEDLSSIGAGSYVLTVTDGNFCQNSTAAIVITEGPQIVATVAANAAAICSGANAVFTITGTAGHVVTYNLNGGSNTTATIAVGGTATVTVTGATVAQTLNLVSVSNGACSNTLTGTAAVTINALPTANAGSNQTVCGGASVTLSGSGTGTYSWNNSVTNGVPFTAVNATAAPITTTYTLTVTNANGCTAQSTVNVTVNPAPIIGAIANQTVCNGASTTLVTLTNNLVGSTYAWTNNTPSIGLAASGTTATIPAFTAVNAGTAPVTATI
ncbi:MAG: beta strand repeat-containing protein, partial [Flavobacteriales bacterium]